MSFKVLERKGELLKDIVLESEKRSNNFIRSHPEMVKKNSFFRFNVLHSLGEIGLEEYKAAPAIASHTATYLRLPDVDQRVELCVNSIATGDLQQAADISQGLASLVKTACCKLLTLTNADARP
jgi:hypothetical protein